MSAGLPVIVPTVGGIAELVDDGVNGYKIDVQQLDVIADRINYMLSSIDIYSRLAKGALATAALYSNTNMCEGIDSILVH
jgi:glycosyltransferase involved in cell wall biosynthesis